MRGATVLIEPLRHTLTTCAAEVGEAPESLARRAHVPWETLSRAGRAPIEALYRVWDVAMRGHRRALPVDVAGALPLERLGPFGFALLTAPDGCEALRTAARAFPLINERARWTARLDGAARLRLDAPAPRDAGEAVSHVAMVSHLLVGLRRVAGERATPRAVRFHQQAPAYARDLAARLGCAITWNAAATEVELWRDPLDAAPALACRATHTLLREHLERALRDLADDRGLAGDLADPLARGDAARELSSRQRVSERTLRRRFAAEGTTLRRARDEARCQRALTLLADASRSVTDVACELGFADASTFARAFRRWTGESPRDARRRARR